MTERRLSTVDPCPPPHAPDSYYDQHSLAVHRAICRACQVAYCVPVRIDAAEFVCSRCADGK